MPTFSGGTSDLRQTGTKPHSKTNTLRVFIMLDTSKIYTSKNHGNFIITEYINYKNIKIRFINTGYETSARSGNITLGQVKDMLAISVYGVGFIGSGISKTWKNGKATKSYVTWKGILERCYCPKSHEKHPTYKDCTVTKEWHDFQVFDKWFMVNYVGGYHIDKDIKVDGNKVYGPEFCKFVSQSDNSIAAKAKYHKFICPKGVNIEIYNLSAFCKSNNLCSAHMSSVGTGARKSHKGWTKG